MVFELMFMNTKYTVINNHLKCCGDGYMDTDDPWDEETRRRDAMVLLEEFIRLDVHDENVILLGDLNDDLADPPANNVFDVFIDNEENYLFVDMEIAKGSIYSWSYPSWPSHLDHILITDVLFDAFSEYGSDVQTLRLDDFFEGGFDQYDANVSDHRPVVLKLISDHHVGDDEPVSLKQILWNSPNPFLNKTKISFNRTLNNCELEIFNTCGEKVESLKVKEGQSEIIWDASGRPGGIYVVRLKSGENQIAIRKMVLLR